MPCMYNGQPVKGNKGSCPMNSTWVEPEAPAPVDDRNLLQKAGGWIKENPLEAASYGLLFGGPVGWGIKGGMAGAKALRAGGLMNSRTGRLMDRLFRTDLSKKKLAEQMKKNQFNTTVANTNKHGLQNPSIRNIPGQPARQSSVIDPFTKKPMNMPAIPASTIGVPNPSVLAPFNAQAGKKGLQQFMDNMGSTRRLSPLKIAGTAGAGAGAAGLYASGADDRLAAQQALQTQQQQQASTAMDANTKALMDANATKAEADRVANLNPMERIMENLKKPGFLTDPLIPGGPPGYNRLSKLGVLMDYYGSTPKQRATKTSPNEQFASIEKDVMTNATALAKAQATLKSQYGKPSTSNLAEGMYEMVKEAYGGTWLPFDDKGEDELKRISTLAAIKLTEMSQDPQYMGVPEDMLREEAVLLAGQELGIA